MQIRNISKTDTLDALIYTVAITSSIYLFWFAYAVPFERRRHGNIYLGIGLALFYLTYIKKLSKKEEKSDRSYLTLANMSICGLLAIVSIATAAYVELNYHRLLFDAGLQGYRTADLAVSALVVLVVTDVTRRAYGDAITAVIIGSIAYGFVGPLMPSIFQHSGMDLEQVLIYSAIGLSDGVYGFILQVGASWVAVFLVFAGVAKGYGLLDFVLSLSNEVEKKLKSGVVEVAVIASMIMGSITGSAAANTATTGSFTIPMMKEQGVKSEFAAAIESVASSGGQLMPPIMGIAAFLMADILGLPYVEIIRAGALPAFLFYFSVFTAVYLLILRFGWLSDETGSFDRNVLIEGVQYVIIIGVLLYLLIIERYSPMGAGLWTTIAFVPLMFVTNTIKEGMNLETYRDTTVSTFEGLKIGAEDMAPLLAVMAGMGIIISLLTNSGFSQRLTVSIMGLAGEVLILILLVGMVASILFGLGMPTPAAYVLVVILVAPALIDLGIRPLTAHFFVFWFAIISAITPPVAIAVAVGSRIANSNFLSTCYQSLRIGAIAFVIPYAMVYNDSLIYWTFPNTAIITISFMIAIFAITSAIIGHDGFSIMSPLRRFIMASLGFVCFFYPSLTVQVLAAGCIFIFSLASQWRAFYETVTENLRATGWLGR